jgi:hypothetical protein
MVRTVRRPIAAEYCLNWSDTVAVAYRLAIPSGPQKWRIWSTQAGGDHDCCRDHLSSSPTHEDIMGLSPKEVSWITRFSDTLTRRNEVPIGPKRAQRAHLPDVVEVIGTEYEPR